MLYQISMFWDGTHTSSKAVAENTGDTHWVSVEGRDAAKTTIFVHGAAQAIELAALINRFTGATLTKPVEPTPEAKPALVKEPETDLTITPTRRLYVGEF